ncbi:uncharacterized protein LOC136074570 [Hydra vulgaris]|uniref:Uncharacterized protein LOC136074570 n=1 Tax=Hydra vulgaris TaxID=6087 RepID=A0ABM4B2D2_HYDVU
MKTIFRYIQAFDISSSYISTCSLSFSPVRWKILQELTKISLHKLSDTRWSARIAAVKPIAKGPREIITALNCTIEYLDLTADMLNQAKSLIKFYKSFETVVLLTFWYKILQVVDEVSHFFQSTSQTIDNKVILIQQLISNLGRIHSSWNIILTEAKAVADPLGFETEFLAKQKKRAKRYHDELANAAFCYESPMHQFEVNIFNVAVDHFIHQIQSKFDIVKRVSSRFSFIRLKDQETDSQEIKACGLAQFYANDLKEDDLLQEICILIVWRSLRFFVPGNSLSLLNQIH